MTELRVGEAAVFVCPRCRPGLSQVSATVLGCENESLELPSVEGTWRFLTPEREAALGRFMEEYATVRGAAAWIYRLFACKLRGKRIANILPPRLLHARGGRDGAGHSHADVEEVGRLRGVQGLLAGSAAGSAADGGERRWLRGPGAV
ncbi:MAG: hypothetical protein HYV63_27495 [Candidatus Schekmanbacteria bacterium]|nr:hypothetical protein [Candidatus Schekmanbacteria bacterium]